MAVIQAVQLPSFATLEDCVTAEHCMTAEHFHDCHSSGVMASNLGMLYTLSVALCWHLSDLCS